MNLKARLGKVRLAQAALLIRHMQGAVPRRKLGGAEDSESARPPQLPREPSYSESFRACAAPATGAELFRVVPSLRGCSDLSGSPAQTPQPARALTGRAARAVPFSSLADARVGVSRRDGDHLIV